MQEDVTFDGGHIARRPPLESGTIKTYPTASEGGWRGRDTGRSAQSLFTGASSVNPLTMRPVDQQHLSPAGPPFQW